MSGEHPSGPAPRGFLGCLAVAATGGAVIAHAASDPSPDAALIAMAEEIKVLNERSDALSQECEGMSARDSDRFMKERVFPMVDRIHELRADMATTPAISAAGLRAKAQIVQLFNSCFPGYAHPSNSDAMAWSLANDMLGVPSVWRAAGESHV
jgi:hypothetical protein